MSATSALGTWSWPAEPSAVMAARRQVLRSLRQARMPDPLRDSVGLVVEEAVANVVVHAYAGTDPGEVRVTVGLVGDELSVLVEDDGAGIMAPPHAPGAGLGLALMHSVAERLEAHAEPGRGTRIRAWFSVNPINTLENV